MLAEVYAKNKNKSFLNQIFTISKFNIASRDVKIAVLIWLL